MLYSKQKNKSIRSLSIITLAIVILFFIALIFRLIINEKTDLDLVEYKQNLEIRILRENIVEHDFADIRMYEVLINQDVTKDQLTDVSKKLINQIIEENQDIDEIYLFFFSNEDLIKTNSFYIGQSVWSPRPPLKLTPEIAEQNIRNNYTIDVMMEGETIEPNKQYLSDDINDQIFENFFTTNQMFQETILQLDDIQKLLSYLNENFEFVSEKSNVAILNPEEFFEARKGREQDFVIFSTYVLSQHNVLANAVAYQYDDRKMNFVTAFEEFDGSDKYIYFDQEGSHLIGYEGNSFEKLCQEEEKRIGMKISKYGLVAPLKTIDF
jgi:hypothetical protein